MTSRNSIVTLGLIYVSLSVVSCPLSAQNTPPAAPLGIEDVIQMHNAGFSEEVIITRIRKNAKPFDLNTPELLELKKAGLSDTIVTFLMDPAKPYAAAPPPAPAPQAARAPKKYPADQYAPNVPPDPGLYRLQDGNLLPVGIKLLLIQKSGAGLGKLMKKAKPLAYLPGPAAKTRTKDPAPVFYLRLAEGKAIEEVVLVAVEHKGDTRELEIGPAAPKPELKPDSIKPFEPVEVGPLLFRLTASKLTPGEYLFFQIGSADPAKGIAGKGFDFGIDKDKAAPQPVKK